MDGEGLKIPEDDRMLSVLSLGNKVVADKELRQDCLTVYV